MSLTTEEVAIVNQALAKISSATITYAVQTSVEGVQANLHYEQTRNALLCMFEWPFASGRTELVILKTLTLDSSPVSDDWVADAEITGISSGTTATIVSVITPLEYEISYISGDFTDGEKITDGTVETVYWEGQELVWEDESVVWWDSSDSNELLCGTGYPVVANVSPDFGWDYQFVLPDDFLRLKSIYEIDQTRDVSDRFVWEGKKILTNEDALSILYVKKITDTTEFDPLFVEVLIIQLALKLLHSLAGTGTGIMNMRQLLLQELNMLLARVKTLYASQTNVTGRSDWTLARFGTGKV